MLAVIDTNVWISAILSPEGFCAPVVTAVRAGRFTPVVCSLMQRELTLVLTRPTFARRYSVSREDITRIIQVTTRRSLWIDDPEVLPVCRDPHDDILIATAVAGSADCLVTRDDDLKGDEVVRAYLEQAGVELFTVREFVATLGAQSEGLSE